MITTEKISVTVHSVINAPVEKVWGQYTNPNHIVHWNKASEDWHTTEAQNDLRPGGKFRSRMEAIDGSSGFDFSGHYESVVLLKHIKYVLDDGRQVQVSFSEENGQTEIKVVFEPENENSLELQQQGWQAILDNFKKYVEKPAESEMLHFEILIDADVEKVYETMIDEKGYREWTAEFNPASRYEGSWTKGSKILFIGEDPNGAQGGMVSKIKENIPYKFISIQHLGILKDGREIYCGPEVDPWAGALENYTFSKQDDKTHLSIDVDADDNFKSYFSETWPKALNRLREICERYSN